MGNERASKGPAPMHSRESLARAAVALADARGLDAVTMRAVAATLGTGAGSLYRYVGSREDLMGLMVEVVTGELAVSEAGQDGWRPAIVSVAGAVLDVYRRHPWLIDVPSRAVPASSVADYLEGCLSALESAPGSSAAKLEASALVLGIVTLFARPGQGGGSVLPPPDAARRPRLAEAVSDPVRGPLPTAGLFERAVLGAVEGILVG